MALEARKTNQNREDFLEKVKQMQPQFSQGDRASAGVCTKVLRLYATVADCLCDDSWGSRLGQEEGPTQLQRSRSGKYRDWYCANDKLQLLFSFLPESNQGTLFHNKRGCLFPCLESRASLARRESPLTKVPTIGSAFLPCA